MDNQTLYHGIVSIVGDAISVLRQHTGDAYADTVKVEWNRRMRSTAGRAFLFEARVELNPRLLHLNEDIDLSLQQVRQTLLHELAHLLAHHRYSSRGIKIAAHGTEWKQACADLGIPGESATHQLPLPTIKQRKKWRYSCPNCSEEILRVRRMKGNSACYHCCKKFNQGKFHTKFQFIEQRLGI